MIPKLPLYCKFVIFFPSTVGNAFQRKCRQSATPMLPISFTWDGRSCCPSHIPLQASCAHTSVPHLPLHHTGLLCTILLLGTTSLPFHMSSYIFPDWILLFLFCWGFFLVPCSCCFPHTHVSLASLSHLTLSIKCPQSQRGICSLRRLLQVLTALQLHQHRHKGVCKPKYPSRVPRGLKLVETPWGSLVKEERQYF